jgi:hypothetical protein
MCSYFLDRIKGLENSRQYRKPDADYLAQLTMLYVSFRYKLKFMRDKRFLQPLLPVAAFRHSLFGYSYEIKIQEIAFHYLQERNYFDRQDEKKEIK